MKLDFEEWERKMSAWDPERKEKELNDLWHKAGAMEKRGAIDQAIQCYRQILAIKFYLGYSSAGDVAESDGAQERIDALLRKQGKRSDRLWSDRG